MSVGEPGDDPLREPARAVDARADRGAAERQRADPRQHVATIRSMPSSIALRVAAELLAERDRRGVHEVGAARLHHRSRTRAACVRSAFARCSQRGDQVARRARASPRGGSPTGTRRSTTATRSRRRSGAPASPSDVDASRAITSFMFMFDDVPEPVWNTSIGKWSSCPPSRHLGGRVVDRARPRPSGSRAAHRSPSPPPPLIERQRTDERPLDRPARDREVLDRALGLRAPLGVDGHPHLAHRVVLDAVRSGHEP